MRVPVEHQVPVDTAQHAEPLAQRHRAHTGLTDVVEIVAPDAPDAVEAWCRRDLRVAAGGGEGRHSPHRSRSAGVTIAGPE